MESRVIGSYEDGLAVWRRRGRLAASCGQGWPRRAEGWGGAPRPRSCWWRPSVPVRTAPWRAPEETEGGSALRREEEGFGSSRGWGVRRLSVSELVEQLSELNAIIIWDSLLKAAASCQWTDLRSVFGLPMIRRGERIFGSKENLSFMFSKTDGATYVKPCKQTDQRNWIKWMFMSSKVETSPETQRQLGTTTV